MEHTGVGALGAAVIVFGVVVAAPEAAVSGAGPGEVVAIVERSSSGIVIVKVVESITVPVAKSSGGKEKSKVPVTTSVVTGS